MIKRVITEENIKRMVHNDALSLTGKEILTPQAKDFLKDLKKLKYKRTLKIAIGADHRGYQFKEELKSFLKEKDYNVLDVGTFNEVQCDYPDFASEVALCVSKGKCLRGIMINGAGIGSSITCNKFSGIRAALCHDIKTAKNSREHNDANILTIGSNLIGIDLAKDIVAIFLKTTFSGGRHKRRIDKIKMLEKHN